MNRAESLIQIITFGEFKEQAFSVLSKCGMGHEDDDLVEVSDAILATVLQKFISGSVSEDELEEWALFIECREDINSDKNEGYIYALANPEFMGAITIEKIHKMLLILDS